MLAILQARTSSRRLPGKVLRTILGRPMIALQIERLRRSKRLTGLVLATSTDASDDILADFAASMDVDVYRGALDDVLARFRGALKSAGDPKTFLRLTADCPLVDPDVLDLCVEHHVDLYPGKPDFRMVDILEWQDAHPDLVLINDPGAGAS